MDVDIAYNPLMKEVSQYKCNLKSSQHFDKIKDNYRGFQILYSPIRYRPDFMFIGINPGAGYFNSTGKNVSRLEPENKMEYAYSNYPLANKTKELFEMAGLTLEDLKKSIKSNFYFIATEKENHLNKMIKDLGMMDFEKKSREWNLRLINMINPKIIICEGKSAMIKVTEHNQLHYKWDNDVAVANWSETIVIGYKRMQSRILNKEELSKIIRKS